MNADGQSSALCYDAQQNEPLPMYMLPPISAISASEPLTTQQTPHDADSSA
jgi:hypothetical protein